MEMEKGYYKTTQVLVGYDERDIEHKDEKGNLLYTEHIKEPIYETKQKWVEYTQTQLAEIEIDSLRNWFNGYYAEHEQKYRRLYTMKLYCDDGTHPYDKLIELYQTAEKNRKRIQELESQYGIE